MYARKRSRACWNLDAFVTAKIAAEGLRRAGRAPTRAGLVGALEGMGRFDAGGYAERCSPDDHNGSSFVDLAIVGATGRLSY